MRGHSAKDIRGAELGDLLTISRDNAFDDSGASLLVHNEGD